MATVDPMSCPACGAPMNHHADKAVQAPIDGGPQREVVEEVYACPRCGAGASRRRALS